jgi:hypothetical protein
VKRVLLVAALAALAAIGHAAEFYGLQTTPGWNDRGDLTVEVANWSKLALKIDSVTARLPGDGATPCEWTVTRAFPIGPTKKYVVILAGREAVDACLRGQARSGRADARALRFVRLPSKDRTPAARSAADAVTLRARLTRHGRLLESTSMWSLAQGDR